MQRKFGTPAFYQKAIMSFFEVMQDECLKLVEDLDRRIRINPLVNISEEMSRLTFTIIVRILFSINMQSRAAEVQDAMRVLQDFAHVLFYSVWRLPLSVPTPSNIKANRALKKLDQIVSNDTPLMALFWPATRNLAVETGQIRHAAADSAADRDAHRDEKKAAHPRDEPRKYPDAGNPQLTHLEAAPAGADEQQEADDQGEHRVRPADVDVQCGRGRRPRQVVGREEDGEQPREGVHLSRS